MSFHLKRKVRVRNIARWEKGDNVPRVEHVRAIARVTGKTVDFFFGEDEDEEAALRRVVDDFTGALVSAIRGARTEEKPEVKA